MAARKTLDALLGELHALRGDPEAPEARRRLGEILRGKQGPAAAKAAEIVAEARLDELVPDLVAAFDTFMDRPVKRDPSCLAKAAIVRALQEIDHDDEELFLRALHCVQLEPQWGGSVDTAPDLRGAGAMALVGMRSAGVLLELADLLADPEPPARAAAARALAYHGHEAGAALLRLRLASGEDDPQVMASCAGALLELTPETGLPFVARRLDDPDPVRFEVAVFALGEARVEGTLAALAAYVERARERERRDQALVAIATMRHDAAIEHLLSLVANASGEVARGAIEALAIYRHDDELRTRVERSARRDDLDLRYAVAEAWD